MSDVRDFLRRYLEVQGWHFSVKPELDISLKSESYSLSELDQIQIFYGDLRGLRNGINAIGRKVFNQFGTHSPAFKIRGIVEGFYGIPWSHEQRLRGLSFAAAHNMNSYILAPKDDPWQRFDWRTPLSEQFLKSTEELMARGREVLVDVSVCISPGLTVQYSEEADVKALMVRYRQLSKIGVKQFGLLLDDIPWELQYSVDQTRYKNIAEAQADFVNRLFSALTTEIPSAGFFVCPLQYHGRGSEPYISEFGNSIHAKISLMWTGRQICSEYLETVDAKFFVDKTSKQPFYWDNYPVNDVAMVHQLHVGPIKNRDSDLGDYSFGLVANPMEKFELSLLSLGTIGDYLWDSHNYHPEESWERALSTLVRDERDRNSLRHFLRNCFESCLAVDAAPDFGKLLGKVSLLWRTNQKNLAVTELCEYSLLIKSHVAVLRSPDCTMPAWVSESESWLNKYEKVADALAEIAIILDRATNGSNGGLVGSNQDIELVMKLRISLAQDPTRIFGDGLDLMLGELATELAVANR